MYFFQFNGKRLCLDAQNEDHSNISRFINHSRTGNAEMKKMVVDNKPRLYLTATQGQG